MTDLTAQQVETLARVAEVVIGLGVDPVPGCTLCARGEPICPIHYGQAIAHDLKPVVQGFISHTEALVGIICARTRDALAEVMHAAQERDSDAGPNEFADALLGLSADTPQPAEVKTTPIA